MAEDPGFASIPPVLSLLQGCVAIVRRRCRWRPRWGRGWEIGWGEGGREGKEEEREAEGGAVARKGTPDSIFAHSIAFYSPF